MDKFWLDNGDSFYGCHVNGLREGYGVYTWEKSKTKYEGNWEKNKEEGKGKISWTNGNIFEGEFQDGKRHG